MRVTEINIYPVKSLGGVTVDTAAVEPWGLAGDRRWAVTAEDGQVHTARDLHAMLGMTATPAAAGAITLAAPGLAPIEVSPPVGGPRRPARFDRLDVAVGADEAADRWMSRALGTPARLVWLEDPRRRPVGPSHGGRPGDTMVLQDDGPLLLTSLASLRSLDDWIAQDAVERGEEPPAALPMHRFRPNVVVDGGEPFAEDSWTRVRIGEVGYRFAEHCDRCVLTTIDTRTLTPGSEPVRTLSRHRKWDGRVFFGVRLIPEGPGEVRLGDQVTPLP
ncbi:MOSC domain-containing protein [Sphaerisporangium rhizosphaerae]|uniref:MOSC domain-containing protein n=1 Tax=Sphaerisporangium rhizosphaerae TaxID=2269375 RepID=A0ABW2P6G3_9ACTN